MSRLALLRFVCSRAFLMQRQKVDDQFEKTEWIEGSVTPVHQGVYEWENPEHYFEGETHIEWKGTHWRVVWRTPFCSGSTIMTEAPCRWRGRTTPPVDVLLEI